MAPANGAAQQDGNPKMLVERAPIALALVVVSTLTTVVLSEIGLRIAGAVPRDLTVNRYLSGRSWAEPHPVLGWKNRQGTHLSVEAGRVAMGFTADGRRAEPDEAGRQPAIKTIILGGSFAQGYGVADNQTFAFLLDRALPDRDVLNFGTGGYSTWQAYLLLRSYFARQNVAKTTSVIYCFISDHLNRNVADFDWIMYLTTTGGRKLVPPHIRLHRGRFFERAGGTVPVWPLESSSALVTKVHQAILKLRHGRSETEKLEVAGEVIGRMADLAHRHSARFLTVSLTKMPSRLNERLKARNLTVLDCHVPGWWRLPDMRVGGKGHPSAKLHARFSQCIARWMRDGGFAN